MRRTVKSRNLTKLKPFMVSDHEAEVSQELLD